MDTSCDESGPERDADVSCPRRSVWTRRSEVAGRPAVETVFPDGRLRHTHRHDAIMPVFCPTRQVDFVKNEKAQ